MTAAAPPDHSTEGIVVVDKPMGPTSFDVVYKVRKALGHKSVGHCGTLDPLASGVIVVCAGRYTKLVRFLTSDDKRYVADVVFGASTPSLDKETEPDVFGDARVVTAAAIERALAPMRGVIAQVPPLHSALQKDGVRLYDKARKGQDVVVAPRDVVVHALTLLSYDEATATARIDRQVGKGFFVRSLARDLGLAVSCPAHLGALRRTHSGGYTLGDAVPLDDAKDPTRLRAALRRGRPALRGVPLIDIDAAQATALRHGRRPSTTLPDQREVLACVDAELAAVVNVEGGHLVSVRGF